MKRPLMLSAVLILSMLGLSAAGCGDDDDKDDDVKVETPGADVKIEKLETAGAPAPAD